MSSQFEVDHAKLLEKVTQGLDQLVTNLNHLNRNLETINTIGNEFEAPAYLWSQFHTAVMTPDNPINATLTSSVLPSSGHKSADRSS
ncbi:hypothetical protein DM01DRAFT_1335532 [Hesseltinella vesiculosa]|uniref:DASH complex subunit DAD1 n=1 Tax=Hesseltinella vesiculosa TaxID=101127 RepID=A0A1X2GI64_9FUNG|nr:hypothetical protein DM01DRAFT_1335532 [Hesseltinella vesiculosa]